MLFTSNYRLEPKPGTCFFYVRTHETPICPHCSGTMKIIGSRKRKVIRKDSSVLWLIIRRLRCTECKKISHEFPDFVAPHKQYSAEIVEEIVASFMEGDSENKNEISSYPCEFSTALRIHSRFLSLLAYIESISGLSDEICKSLQIQCLNKETLKTCKKGWLKVIYRLFSEQTRFA